MKLWDIVKTVGAGVVSACVPGGAALVGVVNALLPEDQKLPDTATGDEIQTAIQGLPPEQAAELKAKQFDVSITEIKEAHATVRAMLDSDAQNPHTTRPYIAKQAFHVVAFAVIIALSLWAYAIGSGDARMVKAIMDGWGFVLAVIGPLVTLLWAYFGILKQEQRHRLNAATGNPTQAGLAGLISVLTKR